MSATVRIASEASAAEAALARAMCESWLRIAL
jgi:hypothetical protein